MVEYIDPLSQKPQQQKQNTIYKSNDKDAFRRLVFVGVDIIRKQANVGNHAPGCKKGNESCFLTGYPHKICESIT
jgi:hypothetical protein